MLLKHLLQVAPSMGAGMLRNLLRSPRHNDLATLITALGTKVNDPVRTADHIQVVLRRGEILVGI